jgi:hypothetical protein
MKKPPEIKQFLRELEFNENWFDLEFISAEKLRELWLDYQTSDDKKQKALSLASIYSLS